MMLVPMEVKKLRKNHSVLESLNMHLKIMSRDGNVHIKNIF